MKSSSSKPSGLRTLTSVHNLDQHEDNNEDLEENQKLCLNFSIFSWILNLTWTQRHLNSIPTWDLQLTGWGKLHWERLHISLLESEVSQLNPVIQTHPLVPSFKNWDHNPTQTQTRKNIQNGAATSVARAADLGYRLKACLKMGGFFKSNLKVWGVSAVSWGSDMGPTRWANQDHKTKSRVCPKLAYSN